MNNFEETLVLGLLQLPYVYNFFVIIFVYPIPTLPLQQQFFQPILIFFKYYFYHCFIFFKLRAPACFNLNYL